METLRDFFPSMQIKENVILKDLNSFKSGGIAKYFCECESAADIQEASKFAKENNLKIFILGGGTNTIFLHNFEGLVIKVAIKWLKIDGNELAAGAGEEWDNLVDFSLKNGLYGLENLSWIPGTVGAAPVQNIGAYGVEIKDFLKEVICYDLLQQKEIVLNSSECKFGYRDSIFKHNKNVIILKVVFKLHPTFYPKVEYGELRNITFQSVNELREKIIEIRKNKLPDWTVVRNCGSFFKNPIIEGEVFENLIKKYPDIIYFQNGCEYKLSAANLIETFFNKRGYVDPGGFGLWPKQALVLYANENADSKNLGTFYKSIIKVVKDATDIELIPEVNIIN